MVFSTFYQKYKKKKRNEKVIYIQERYNECFNRVSAAPLFTTTTTTKKKKGTPTIFTWH